MLEQDNDYISRVSIYNWVQKRTQEVKKEVEKLRPSVGDVWVFIETLIPINGKDIWVWDIVDTKTKFLIVSQLSETRADFDIQQLMEKAWERVGKYPETLFHNNRDLSVLGKKMTREMLTVAIGEKPVAIMNNSKLVKHIQSFLVARSRAMRDLKSIRNAGAFLNGWLVHYNYFKPNPAANNRTPAYVAGLTVPRRENLNRIINRNTKLEAVIR